MTSFAFALWTRYASNPGMPGVGLPSRGNEGIKYTTYYQWVPYVLFFQSLLFRMPYAIWKRVEGSRIEKFRKGVIELVSLLCPCSYLCLIIDISLHTYSRYSTLHYIFPPEKIWHQYEQGNWEEAGTSGEPLPPLQEARSQFLVQQLLRSLWVPQLFRRPLQHLLYGHLPERGLWEHWFRRSKKNFERWRHSTNRCPHLYFPKSHKVWIQNVWAV